MVGPAVWAGRAALVAVATAGLVEVARMSLAARLADSAPQAAARLTPEDARLATRAAQDRVEHGAAPGAPEVRQLVRAALARDATLPQALELRALAAAADGDTTREGRLFELSGAVSRRSLPTRMWLIQRAVGRGDVEGALEDFDIALRTSAAAPQLLFPVLARAAADPDLARPIARVLDRPEEWREMFLAYAVRRTGDASGAAAVMARMQDRAFLRRTGLDRQVVEQLLREARFDVASAAAAALRPGSGGLGGVRDASFTDAAGPPPFGWTLTANGDLEAERGLSAGRPVLQVHAGPDKGGQAAVEALALQPGAWILSTRTAAAGLTASWSLTCASNRGPALARLPQPAAADGMASAELVVPPGCRGQWLTLVVEPQDGTEQSGAIAEVRLDRRPVQPASRSSR